MASWRSILGGLASAAALAACAARGVGTAPSGELRRVPLDAPFTLAVGERVEIESLAVVVEFRSLESDSRCPRDLTCVWAGDGAAVVGVSAGERLETVTLHTNLEPRKTTALGLELELGGLSPYPVSGGKREAREYRATLRARRAAS
jgi:hypothetical protein